MDKDEGELLVLPECPSHLKAHRRQVLWGYLLVANGAALHMREVLTLQQEEVPHDAREAEDVSTPRYLRHHQTLLQANWALGMLIAKEVNAADVGPVDERI